MVSDLGLTMHIQSLYALLRNNPDPSKHDVEEAFDGNLCRCTGYRPILDAAQSFSVERTCGISQANGDTGCCMQNGADAPSACCKTKSNGTDSNARPVKRF